METTTKTKNVDYWECSSCKITSKTKGRWCPCPRASCDASLKGVLEITTITKFIPKKGKK